MRTLRRTTKTSMDERDSRWPEWRGDPTSWMTWDGMKIRLDRFVEGIDASVGFLEIPLPMHAEGGPYEPDARLPKDCHEYLPYAAAAYLLSLDGDTQDFSKAKAYFEEFDARVGGKNERGPNVLPG